jgi:hypothetical protein
MVHHRLTWLEVNTRCARKVEIIDACDNIWLLRGKWLLTAWCI